MILDRRSLMAAAAAAGLAAAAPKPARRARPAPRPGSPDTALEGHLQGLAERLLARAPEQATSLGLDSGPRAALKGRLSDASPGSHADDVGFCRKELAALAAFPDARLSPRARLDKSVVAYALQLETESAPFDYGTNTLGDALSENAGPYVVNQQSGVYSFAAEFLDSKHTIENAQDAEAYLSRLHDAARSVGFETERALADAGKGVVPPDFILANTLGQQATMLQVKPADSRLVVSIRRKTAERKLGGGFGDRALKIVEGEFYPALARQTEALKQLQAKSGHDAGVWRLPEGEAYYRWLLKDGTTTDLSPDEVHRMGLEQNREIQGRMDAILKANGLAQGTVGERMAALGRDPRFLFPDDDAGRAQILAYINGVIAAVRPRLPKAFTLRLKAPVIVKRVPVEIQEGAGQGYMNPGSMDGSRPSTYYINLKTTQNWPKFTIPDLSFHEAIPGHAWQGAYLTETGRLPLIRIVVSGFNAYVEGWALYAEQLADEIGMYDDDWAGRLGFLQGHLWRAVRLVVDTGLHAKRWGREQAIQWAMDNSGHTRDYCTSEIDRYCSTPGQACGYKVGQTEIERMRARAKAKLGPRYDLRAFDDLVVETGAVPISVLGKVVDDWVASGGRMTL